jgi:hypothetical protein
MARTPKFTGIREVPLEGTNFALFESMTSMKQNLELLTGQRGESDSASRAITPAYITVSPLASPRLTSITAQGEGFTLQGVKFPGYDDYIKALTDIQKLALDVADIRATLNNLLTQLRG